LLKVFVLSIKSKKLAYSSAHWGLPYSKEPYSLVIALRHFSRVSTKLVKMSNDSYSDEEYEYIDKMKITHTIHEMANGGRSTSRAITTTQKLKNLFCFRGSEHEIGNRERDQEALIQPASPMKSTSTPEEIGVAALLLKEHEELKRRQERAKRERIHDVQPQKVSISANSNRGLYRQRTPGVRNSAQERTVIPPALKRKGSLENMRPASPSKPAERQPSQQAYLDQLRAQRKAMSAGKLEKVVAPFNPVPRDNVLIPPRKLQTLSPPHSRPANSPSPSRSEKLSAYMGTSADLLDATRRDVASNLKKRAEIVVSGKFLPPLAGFDYHAPGRGNAVDDSESDSDESFYCVGEKKWRRTDGQVSTRQLEKERRISTEKADPWSGVPLDHCRLCRKKSPGGIRGLCLDCEAAFRRPKTEVFLSDEEKDIKPTTPLKIRKSITPPSTTLTCFSQKHDSDPYSRMFGKSPTLDRVDNQAKLVNPSTHHSQQALIEGESHSMQSLTDKISKFESWQTAEMRTELAMQETSRWSPRLLDDPEPSPKWPSLRSKFNTSPVDSEVAEDTKPLIAERNVKSQRVQKTDSFYGFWDDVLMDHGANPATLRKAPRRYQRM
jgi:hypothetical protein